MSSIKVGKPGSALNKQERLHLSITANTSVRFSQKASALKDAKLKAALGLTTAKPAGAKEVYKCTESQARRMFGALAVTLEYKDKDEADNDITSYAKVLASPLKTLADLTEGIVGKAKYHGTFDITGVSVGW